MTETDLARPNGANDIANAITALSYADLIADPTVDRVLGRSVVDKSEMIGKPFIITGITFNPSDKQAGGDFVSLEITTADDATLVINDSSTGIRRQVITYACNKGWISVPETVADGKNPYDVPMTDFTLYDGKSGIIPAAEQGQRPAVGIMVPIRLRAPRGLRRSDYVAAGARPAGTTFYLA